MARRGFPGEAPVKYRLKRHAARTRVESRRWLDRHPRVARLLDVSGCLSLGDHAIARGVGAGLFIALTPLFGAQTLLLIAACILVRGNFPAAFLVSWVSNPFTIGPMIVAFNAIGRGLFGSAGAPPAAGSDLAGAAAEQTLLTLAGSLVVSAPVAVAAYLLTLGLRRRVSGGEPRG